MKRFIAMVCLAVVLGMAGCAAVDTDENRTYRESQITEVHKTLDDGRTVTCLIWVNEFSCDWLGASEGDPSNP